MAKSPNLGLNLTAANDTGKTFLDFRTELSGTDGSSNMMILDDAVGKAQQAITSHKQTNDANISSLQSGLLRETVARTNADTNLQAQIDQIVVPAGTIDGASAAEVENARVGANNKTYPALGDAIRGQVSDLREDIADIEDCLFGGDIVTYNSWTVPGGINKTTGELGGSFPAGKARTGSIPVSKKMPLVVRFDTSKYAALVWGYDSNGNAVRCYTDNDFSDTAVLVPVDPGVARIKICLRRADNAAMTVDEGDSTSDIYTIPATTYIQLMTDQTLAKFGSAADAKATGDAISAVQSNVDRRALELIRTIGTESDISLGWIFTGAGIRAKDGINIGPFNYLCRTGYHEIGGDQLAVVLNDPDYLMTVWIYSAQNDSNSVYSPTGETYTQQAAIIPSSSEANYFRVGVKRVDGADLTTDLTDSTSDASRITAGVTVYKLTNGLEARDIATITSVLFTANKTIGSWTIPGGINPENGTNGGNFAAGKARSDYINIGDSAMCLHFKSTYKALVWGYNRHSHDAGVKSYTNKEFVDSPIVIPKESGVTCFRVCIKRADNAALTTDLSDPTSDAYFINDLTYIAPLTDSTLSISGAVADAKVTGDAVATVQEDVDRRTLELIRTLGREAETPVGWQFTSSGIRARDGVNISGYAKYCRTGYRKLGSEQLAVVLTDPDYLMTVWTYGDHNDSNPVYSPTGPEYTQQSAIVPVTNGANYLRVGVIRVDGADLTTDLTDPNSDASRITAGIKVYQMIDGSGQNFDWPEIQNIKAAISGGTIHPYLEQGSANYNNTYWASSVSSKRVRVPIGRPLLCFAGDKVDTGGLYVYMRRCEPTVNGYIRVAKVNDKFYNGTLVVPANGLYEFVAQTAEATADCIGLLPEDAAEQISITHYGLNAGGGSGGTSGAIALPKNPYLTVVWDRVEEIMSFTHGHCTKQAAFNRYKEHYDHLCLTNYHASVPTYPASKYFDDADGILESPNTEHVYFPGYSSHVHLNSVGSFVASGASNTAAGSGGYQGTIEDFMSRAEAMLKIPNAGGVTINHPAFARLTPQAAIAIASIGPVFALELHSGTGERDEANLEIWDGVLSEGFQLFGVCTPDWGLSLYPNEDYGYGYNHMLVYTGTEQEILLAYRNGLFYSTVFNDGLKLTYFGINDGTVTVKVNRAGTIKFVTANGETVVESSETATYDVQDEDIYVRAEILSEGNRLFTNAIML